MLQEPGRVGQKPVFLRDGKWNVEFQKHDKIELSISEDWYQRLIDMHPRLLLADKFGIVHEPISIGMEYETTHGKYIDNLFLTRNGEIILVEDKLLKNEGSRRVIAQAIDYAQDLQKWTYEDLDNRFCKQRFNIEKMSLYEYINQCSGGTVDHNDFTQAIENNLKTATFLILIVGDKIHSDTETMAAFLNQHMTMNIQIGLIEIEVYISAENDWVVIPYLTTKTRTVDKTYIRVLNKDGTEDVIKEAASSMTNGLESEHAANAKASTNGVMLSDESLYSAMERNYSSETRDRIQSIVDDIRNNQLDGFFVQRRTKSFCIYLRHAKLLRPLALLTISDSNVRFDQNVFRAVYSDSEIESETYEPILGSYVRFLTTNLGFSGDKELKVRSLAVLAENKVSYFEELRRLAQMIDEAFRRNELS